MTVRSLRAAVGKGMMCAALLALVSAGASSAAQRQTAPRQLVFGMSTADDELKGSGALGGTGTEHGVARLVPIRVNPFHRTAGFDYSGGDHGRIRLTVTSGSYFLDPANADALHLNVEVTESNDPACAERTDTKRGARGKVVLTVNHSGSTIELDLACGEVHRVWHGDGSEVTIDYQIDRHGQVPATTTTAATTTAAAGAFSGGTATKLTFTIGSVSVTTNLKTGVQTPADPVLTVSPTQSLSGSATLDGTLPKGWKVVVFHLSGDDILLSSASGGKFSGVKAISTSFDGSTRPGAYICGTAKVPPLCSPAAQANISIVWKP